MACVILVPWPGMGHVPPAVEVRGFNHWTTREVPNKYIFKSFFPFVPIGVYTPGTFILLYFCICCFFYMNTLAEFYKFELKTHFLH